jgi:hypothetical protein
MSSLGWKGCFLQVMPDNAVWIHHIFHLNSKAKLLDYLRAFTYLTYHIHTWLRVGDNISVYYSSKHRSQPIRHTPDTGTCCHAYKTCKNWLLCTQDEWLQHNQPCAEKSVQCAVITWITGLKTCIWRAGGKGYIKLIWHLYIKIMLF